MHQSLAGIASGTPRSAVIAACSLLLLAACEKRPEGQVVAVMDGQEITLQELNQELSDANMPNASDDKAIRKSALQNIIDRKLVADLAREEAIDETPEYIVREQRMKDSLLIQMFAQKVGRALKQPTPEQVSQFIAQNPNKFEQRALLLVDQIRLSMTQDPDVVNVLRNAKTVADVEQMLASKGLRFERGEVQFDTAKLPLAVAEKIRSLPAGEPFVIPTATSYTVNLVTATKPTPVTGDAAKPIALAELQQRALKQELQNRMKAARAKAKIDYQKGLEPPAASAAAGASAAPSKQ